MQTRTPRPTGADAEGAGLLTRRARRPLPVVAVGMLVAAMAIVWLTTTRLDAVAARAPGVWDSTQLVPFAQDALYSVRFGQRQSVAGADLERRGRDEVRSLLSPLSADVAVASWPRDRDQVVVVGVAETSDPAAAAASLDGAAGPAGSIQTMRAWAEGERFVVVVGAAVPPPGDPRRVADLAADQVEASVRFARAAWFVTAAMGPVVALVAVVAIFVFAGWIVMLAALIVRLVVFLLVQVPLAILTARRRGSTRPPRLSTQRPPRPSGLAGHVHVLDIDPPTTTPAARLGRMGAAVVLLAVALPALTPAWWPGSLVGAALVGAWLLLRALGGNRFLVRALRWALMAVAGAALADSLFGAGVVDPSGHPAVSGAIVAAAVVMLLVFLRTVLTGGRRLPYAPWIADLGPRSMAYLLAAIGLLVAGTGLFLGSNGDPDLRAHLENKALGAAALLAAPLAARRFRAAQDASRREWAREKDVPEVLLLRSFADDGLTVRSRRRDRLGLERFLVYGREPFEDVVVRAFEAIGPVVAIAKPGTGAREFGADRDRILVEDWLTAVKEAMVESAYVVAVLGRGRGLHQELVTLQELGLFDRVCLLVPPIDAADAAARLSSVTGLLAGPEGWGSLESDEVEGGRVVALLGEGSARFVIVCRSRDLARPYARLGEWLAERPAHERRPRRSDGDVANVPASGVPSGEEP